MPFVVTNDGVKLAYNVQGSGQAILLVHGWSGSSQSFQLNTPELANHFQVITYDQRFHGHSDKPAHGFHVARLAADMRDLILALHLRSVVVVGTSLGCSVIWSYIELYGLDPICRAVFVDQAPLQNNAPDWRIGSKGCYDVASLANLQCALRRDMAAFAQGNLECCATLPVPEAVAQTLHSETLRCDPEHLGRLMADHTQLDWRPTLPRVSVPCLNVVGRHSGVFPVEGVEMVSRLIPGCITAYFEHANHWLYLEAPRQFNRLVTAFVQSRHLESSGDVLIVSSTVS